MIVIKDGLIVDPASDVERLGDVVVEAGKIKAIEAPNSGAERSAAKVVDARGAWVVPGLVDLHVHLREPGFEWKETIKTGSEAAVLGGYTTILCMPNTKPVNDNAEITRFILDKAAARAAKVRPIGAVSLNLEGREMAPLTELFEAGCAAFSDDGEPVWSSALMRRALEWCSMLGVPIACHEEDKGLSAGGAMNESPLSYRLGLRGMPKMAEDVMVARDIEIARAVNGKIHICHVSSARSVELIRRAKNDGVKITAEVAPHHLVLTEAAVSDYDTNSKMSPPLREEEDIAGLIAGIKDGTIDAIASDHAPHERDRKDVEFSKAAFGILGLQTTLPLMLSFVRNGTLTAKEAVALMSSKPARAFGLKAGTLSPGSPGDISIIRPERRWTFSKDLVQSLSLNSPFLGKEMVGSAETVLVDGKIAVYSGKLSDDRNF